MNEKFHAITEAHLVVRVQRATCRWEQCCDAALDILQVHLNDVICLKRTSRRALADLDQLVPYPHLPLEHVLILGRNQRRAAETFQYTIDMV